MFRPAHFVLGVLIGIGGTAFATSNTPLYPSWLVMEPGYAEACIAEGGCLPMTNKELEQLVQVVRQRTLQIECRNRT